MQLCMNDVTIMKHSDLLSRISAAGDAGFPAMEIRKAAILQALREGCRIADIRRALENAGIELACVNAVDSISFNGKRGTVIHSEAAEYLFYLVRELGCSMVEVIGTFKAPTEDPAEIRKETAEALLRLSDLARPYGINLGLEFMGLPASSVKTLAQSLEILEDVNRDNVGILFDSWHHYAAGGTVEEILKVRPEQMFMVHVSDCPERAPLTARRSESWLPGEGVVPIAEQLAALKQIGYDGPVSAEIMSPEVQDMPLSDCLAACRDTLLPLLP